MSLETELEAIQTAAAIAPLPDRAFLRITGSDATRWLNGMVTNNIKDLSPGEGNYNFLLNAQGRIQGDCTIYREPGNAEPSFLLETDKTQLETIHQLLDKFIIMDDVELSTDITLPLGFAVIGEKANDVIAKALLESEENLIPGKLAYRTNKGDFSVLVLFPPHKTVAYELWTATSESANTLLGWLLAAGATELSPAALEAHRILTATPRYGIDIRNTETAKDLPQETAQTHALHFNKGCYLGQEIVERIHSRGQVHRAFTAFTLTGDLPQLPAPLEAHIEGQTKPAGELTSAIQIGDTIHALGYLRREFAKQPLTHPNGTATPKSI